MITRTRYLSGDGEAIAIIIRSMEEQGWQTRWVQRMETTLTMRGVVVMYVFVIFEREEVILQEVSPEGEDPSFA